CGVALDQQVDIVIAAQAHPAGQRAGVPVTRIGRIDTEPGLRLIDAHGKPVAFSQAGFDHFSSTS
ncbi:thiamine-phosphate kinase, partial [Ralstonia pseudosolanacearum]